MGDGTPLIMAIIILFLIGGIVPLIVNSFIPEGSYNQDSFINPIYDFVENGQEIDLLVKEITFNPFSWFGESVQNSILAQLGGFSYIPNYFAIPLLIIVLVSMVYTVVKLMPTT